jgi:CO/xanthine dehydrogenase Mo-binding subunit
MVGELNSNAIIPAVGNAVASATGVRLRTFPMTAERIHAALKERDARPLPHIDWSQNDR